MDIEIQLEQIKADRAAEALRVTAGYTTAELQAMPNSALARLYRDNARLRAALEEIARVPEAITFNGIPCDRCVEVHEIAAAAFEAECEANARLIAAAPDLLAVCQALYSMVWQGPVYNGPGPWVLKQGISNDLLQQLNAAVAKARGE